MPITVTPSPESRITCSSSPLFRIHRKSAIVFFVPGIKIRWGLPSFDTLSTYRRDTPSSRSKAVKSVKLEIWGRRITAASNPPVISSANKCSERLSSSSISIFSIGTRPTTGIFTKSSIIRTPGFKIAKSPRNLLIISPRIRSCSSGSNNFTVP